MEPIVLDNIPFEINMAALQQRLHVREGSEDAEELQTLVGQALAIGRPRALTGVAYLDTRTDEGVIIDGVAMASRVLRVNLDKAHRVFPYVCTCGMELQTWSDGLEDLLHHFWAEAIKEAALGCATRAVDRYVTDTFQPGKTARMSPGSLADWPLPQQRPLFALLGNPQAAIGVQLTDSCLMVPNKSVSGIRFPTEESFESCQLCPRDGCPGRRAPYDRELYDKKYRAQT